MKNPYANLIGAITAIFLVALMIGCIVIVCKLFSQLDDADDRKNRSNEPQISDQPHHAPSDQQPTGDHNQLSQRPTVIGQTWIESGMCTKFAKTFIKLLRVQRQLGNIQSLF